MERTKVALDDLHDILCSSDIRPFAKTHISHEGVVRLITAYGSGWGVEVLTPLFVQIQHASSDSYTSIAQ